MTMMKREPQLRFPEFSGEWKKKKMDEVCDVVMGASPSSSYYNDLELGLPLIQGNADICNKKTSPRIYTNQITKTCEIGDILLSVRAPVGSVSRSVHHACIGRGVCSIKPFENKDFMFQFLENHEGKWSGLSQGSTFESINKDDICNLNLCIPSLPEQQKIADCLNTVDESIESQQQKVEQLKEYKKGLLQQLFSQSIRFPDFEGEWEEKKLGEIGDIKKGEQLNKNLLKPNGKYYALNGGVEPSGYTDKYNSLANTISISEGGTSCGYVNFNKDNFWSGGHCYTLENLINSVSVTFLFQSLKHNQERIMNLRVGTGLPNIQKTALSKFQIQIPHCAEQQKLADCLSTLDEVIELENQKLEQLRQYKKGLLQQLFV